MRRDFSPRIAATSAFLDESTRDASPSRSRDAAGPLSAAPSSGQPTGMLRPPSSAASQSSVSKTNFGAFKQISQSRADDILGRALPPVYARAKALSSRTDDLLGEMNPVAAPVPAPTEPQQIFVSPVQRSIVDANQREKRSNEKRSNRGQI